MVKKFLSFINKEAGSLHQAAYVLAAFAFLSQVLGLFRDRLLASYFGAGLELDLYYAAFRLPDFLFVSIASLVSVSVLIPLLVERMDDENRRKTFLNNVFSFFFITIIGACLAVFFLAPFLLRLIFPGFEEESYITIVLLTRILLLSPIFLGFSNLLGSIVQAKRRFLLYSLSPLVYNASIILGIILFVPSLGIIGVALGVVIGAFGHFAVLIPYVWKVGMLPKLSLKWFWEDLKTILFLSVPRTLALSMNHISLLFLLAFASLLSAGSIAIFNLAYNLQSVPLSIVGVSYSLAAFPTLAQFFANGERTKFVEQIITAAKHIIFWSLPVAVLFIVLRAQIVRVIFGSGEFSWSDTRLTAASLAIFAISVVSQSLNLLFTRGYYAAGNTRKPLIINAISSVLIVVFSFGLLRFFQFSETFRYFIETLFRVEDLSRIEILMLPLGFSLGMIVNNIMLWQLFKKDFGDSSKRIFESLFHSFSTAVIMGFVTYLYLQALALWINQNTLLGIFLQGFIAGIVGIFVGVLVFMMLDNKEIKTIWFNFHKRIWKAPIVASDAEIT